MKITSHALLFKDFNSEWYKHWAGELKQDKNHLDHHALRANKFWQNAVMAEALAERGALSAGRRGLGFGVGQERLPALFAKLGCKITATDQDFRADSAALWAEHELATGPESLNRLGICQPNKFRDNVSFQSVDMTAIPKSLYNQFNFLWSNCALGHLGSIPAGLKFIEKSLECLKPGGWAVHTTEVNILSDSLSVDSGDTVIFRLQDIYNLFLRLTEQGYECSPLKFDLGRSKDDMRLSLRPVYGNDFSKIQVGGHLATQVVLIIGKPKRPKNRFSKKAAKALLRRAYLSGRDEMGKYAYANTLIKKMLQTRKTPLEKVVLKPVKKTLKVEAKADQLKEVFVEYQNLSPVDIYSVHGRLSGLPATLLATANPHNRPSIFASKSWVGAHKDRPSSDFYKKNGSKYEAIDYVPAGDNFYFKTVLNCRGVKPGTYTEDLTVVQEGKKWINGAEVKLQITVGPKV